jgi:hypothetical protein
VNPNYLLLSHHHHLLPMAAKLRKEGVGVQHAPWRARFDRAWEGALDSPLKGEAKRSREDLAESVEQAQRGELVVVSDSPKWAELYHDAASRWGVTQRVTNPSPLRACGWWDGESLHAAHLLFVDMGAWPSGLGPSVEGGATLVDAGFGVVTSALAPYLEELKASGHRGLVQVHLDREMKGLGWEGGWYPLHLHAWLAAQSTPLHALLGGGIPQLAQRFTVVVPVTVAPWPTPCDYKGPSIPLSLPKDVVDNILWHDVRIEDGGLATAQLDGLVGVAYGGAQSLTLARQRALARASELGKALPGRQLRPDVGNGVEAVLAGLEERGLL